jgi:hypothetical protein
MFFTGEIIAAVVKESNGQNLSVGNVCDEKALATSFRIAA